MITTQFEISCGLNHGLENRELNPNIGLAWIKQCGSQLFIFLLPFTVIWTGVISYFYAIGSFNDFYEIVFVFNRKYSGSIGLNTFNFFFNLDLFFNPVLKEIGILVVFSSLWILSSRREYGPLRRPFFIFLVFGLWVEVASPGKYQPHYYQLLIPIYVILSSLFIADLVRIFESQKILKTVMISLLLTLSIASMGFYQYQYFCMSPNEISLVKYDDEFIRSFELANFIKSRTKPSDTLCLGRESGVYFYSQRKAASGIFQILSFRNVPDRVTGKMYNQICEEIMVAKPAYIIWNTLYGYGGVKNSPYYNFIRDNYRLVQQNGNHIITEYKYREMDNIYRVN